MLQIYRAAAAATSLLLTLVLITACSQEPDSAPAESGNALLSHVPAGSPYVLANLRPVPDDVIDHFLAQAEPALTTMQTELAKIKVELESDSDAAETGNRLLVAILQELDGKLNRSGLESLGFDLQADQVYYGMGAFPIYRLGLSDAGIFRDTVKRVVADANVNVPEMEYQGKAFWRFSDEDISRAADGFEAGLYVSIIGDAGEPGHLVIGLLPIASEQDLLPHLLAMESGGPSDAQERLEEISDRFDYDYHSVGVIDMVALTEELLDANSTTTSYLRDSGVDFSDSLSDVCKIEYRAMAAQVPALYFGTTELTKQSIGMKYVVETEDSIARQLADLVSGVPVANPQSSRMLDLSFGLKFGPTRDFLRGKAQAIAEAPYQCENLAKVNQQAVESFAQLNQPMPPLLNNFQGLRVELESVIMNGMTPAQAQGLLAVHVVQPQMFVGMAQMFLPDLSELNLLPGEPPVQLPANLIPVPDLIAFAALNDDAIGMSVGAGEEVNLPPFLDRKTDPDGTFLSVNYDTAAYMDMTGDFSDQWRDETNGENEHVVNIAEAIEQVQKSMADRTIITMGFNEDGIVINNVMTYQ